MAADTAIVGPLSARALRLLRELGATRVRVGDTEVEFLPLVVRELRPDGPPKPPTLRRG